MNVTATIVVTIFTFLVMAYRKSIFNFIKFRRMISKIPVIQKTAYPIIGHSYLAIGSRTEFFIVVKNTWAEFIEKTREKVGVFWSGPVPIVFLLHPDSIETILKNSEHLTKSFMYFFLHPWLGTGLLTSSGEKWKQRRRLITPSFHFNVLEDYLQVMTKQSRIMINTIAEQRASNKRVDVGKAVTLCALDIICETAMGLPVNAQSNSDSAYVTALDKLADLVQLRQKTPWFWWDYVFKKTKAGKEHDEALNVLHSFTKNVIEQRMKNTVAAKNVSKKMAFLDMLIHATTEDGKSLSLSDIQEEVDTFMFEGHDTTAAAMTWAIYLIGRHPDVQRRLQEELDQVFGDDENRSATIEEIKKLQYLEQVIKEALRVYPSVPFYDRVISKDCEIEGYTIPKGAIVTFSTYNLHHHPDVWDDPETFNPDRFTKENCAGRHPFAFLPFSAGPRNCIGQRFALLEEKVIISQILRQFSVTSHDKPEDVQMAGDLILRPTVPLNITLCRRSSVNS